MLNAESELIEEIVDLTLERDGYRLLAQQAIHALHDRGVELDRLREQHHRLIDEFREVRQHLLRNDGVAA